MAILQDSIFYGTPMVEITVGDHKILAPDLSDYKVPLIDDGDEFMVLDESTGEVERDYDVLAIECKHEESDWWRLALANFEEVRSPLEIPDTVDIIGPRYERELRAADVAVALAQDSA